MCEHLDYTATDRPRCIGGLHRLAYLPRNGQKGMDTMSDRPQWMKDAAITIAGAQAYVPASEAERVIARHYAAEDARVRELRTATREFADIAGATKVETVMARQRVYKALKAFEPVSAPSAGGEHV